MYKQFNFTYNAEALRAIDVSYNESPRLVKGPFQQLDIPIIKESAVVEILEKFNFIGSSNIIHNFGLNRIVGETVPYISPGNNGLIILPVTNPITVKFYSYRPVLKNGRPYLDPYETTRDPSKALEVSATYTQSLVIDRPTAINGLRVHSVHSDPANPSLVFLIKIPKDVSWDTIEYALDDLS